MAHHRLLIVAHAPSANTLRLRAAVAEGARAPEIEDVAVEVLGPLETRPEHVLAAGAIILGTPELDFPQFDRARRPEMMSLAMPYDGVLGELMLPVDRPSGGVGMLWQRSIEDTCAAGATRFYGCDDDTSLFRRCRCGAGATGPRHLVVRLP